MIRQIRFIRFTILLILNAYISIKTRAICKGKIRENPSDPFNPRTIDITSSRTTHPSNPSPQSENSPARHSPVHRPTVYTQLQSKISALKTSIML